MKNFIVILLLVALFGCQSTSYQFGDISTKVNSIAKSYCESTDPILRAALKRALARQGVVIGVDFCMARNLVDALLTPKQTYPGTTKNKE
ncbi:hypothetical protein [Cognaticolwellia mytili]|uniref:hypothetical protein n=1 Tax=Cognaticolwellia mytili TaxID=1888913 RepID=UPI000A16D1F5|nr:hypothetical protein [Cognaticolwellia mytili]